MPNALQITDPNAYNPLAQAPSWADAYGSVAGTVSSGVDALGQWLAAQRAKQQRPITSTDLAWAHQQVQQAMQIAPTMVLGMMGTTATGPRSFSLEQVHPRTLRPLPNEPNLAQPGAHAYSIKDPTGEPVGTVDTAWNPDTGNLHIADIQSNEGANSLGLAAVRQIRDLLLARYPGARTLSGQRITGAVSADRPSGSGPGRYTSQTVE